MKTLEELQQEQIKLLEGNNKLLYELVNEKDKTIRVLQETVKILKSYIE